MHAVGLDAVVAIRRGEGLHAHGDGAVEEVGPADDVVAPHQDVPGPGLDVDGLGPRARDVVVEHAHVVRLIPLCAARADVDAFAVSGDLVARVADGVADDVDTSRGRTDEAVGFAAPAHVDAEATQLLDAESGDAHVAAAGAVHADARAADAEPLDPDMRDVVEGDGGPPVEVPCRHGRDRTRRGPQDDGRVCSPRDAPETDGRVGPICETDDIARDHAPNAGPRRDVPGAGRLGGGRRRGQPTQEQQGERGAHRACITAAVATTSAE